MRHLKPAKTAAFARAALLIVACLPSGAPAARADIEIGELWPTLSSGRVYYSSMSSDGDIIVGQEGGGISENIYIWNSGVASNISVPSGSAYTSVGSMSANGYAFVGTADLGGYQRGYVWNPDDGFIIVPLPGGSISNYVHSISADGTTVVGTSTDSSVYEAFTWSAADGLTQLGFLSMADQYSFATGISSNKQIIIGGSRDATGVTRAVRWVSGSIESLGDTTSTYSESKFMTSDGSVILVESIDGSMSYHASRWTQAGGLVDLGVLAGHVSSQPDGMANDGSVVIGHSTDASYNRQGFYWTLATGIQPLESYGDSTPTAISGDGGIVVGTYSLGSGGANRPYIWNMADGAVDLSSYLASAGVDLTNWDFDMPYPGRILVSNSGDVIIGDALLSATETGYIINLAASGGPGITTPEDLVLSQQPLAEPVQQSQILGGAGVEQNLYIARNAFSFFVPGGQLAAASVGNAAALNDLAPAAGGTPLRHWSSYVIGSFGLGQYNDISNHSYNGSTGLLVQLGPDFIIGGGLFAGQSFSELRLGGDSKVSLTGGSLSVSYEDSASQLRLYGTVLAGHLELDSQRNYANGGGVDSSYGSSEGQAYAASLRAGWELAGVHELAFMPYVQIEASHTKMGAYLEQDGAFPSAVEAHTSNLLNGSLGLEVSRSFDGLELRGRTAWGHRFSADDEGVTTTVASMTQTVAGDAGDRNWLEIGASANYALSEKLTLMGDLSGRLGRTAAPAGTLMLGLKYNFN